MAILLKWQNFFINITSLSLIMLNLIQGLRGKWIFRKPVFKMSSQILLI